MSDTLQRGYGIADRKEVAELNGRQILQAMIDGKLPAPPMAKALAFELIEVDEGFAAFEGSPDETFLKPLVLLLSEDQMSDHKGARLIVSGG